MAFSALLMAEVDAFYVSRGHMSPLFLVGKLTKN
jgi:hypothetical protein